MYSIITAISTAILCNQRTLSVNLVVKLVVVIIRRAPAAVSTTSVANASPVAADTTIGTVAVPVARAVPRAWT